MQVNQPYSNPLTVIVRDGFGSPLNGFSVTFNSPGSGASGTFTSTGSNSETVSTDSSGSATSSIFTANNEVGTYIVTASVPGLIRTANFSFKNLSAPGIPAIISISNGNNQKRIVNQLFTNPIGALVTDSLGTPIQGVNVTFTSPASGPSGTFSSTSTFSETVSTNSSGIATSSTIIANSIVGSFTITAFAEGVATPANFTLTNLKNGIYVDASMPDDNGNCITPATACKTINGALSKATAGDTIYVASGTYTGNGTTSVVSINKNITILGGWVNNYASQTGNTILDGQSARRVVDVINAGNVSLDHLTITNGSYFQMGNTVGGGGIYISHSNLSVSNSTVMSNKSYRGAGIFLDANNSGAVLNLKNSTITNNTSNEYGGGIGTGNFHNTSTEPSMVIQNSTITNNTTGYFGGGISITAGTATIQNSIIARNNKSDCYGTLNSTTNLIIQNVTDCTISSGTFSVADPLLTDFLVGAPAFYPLLSNSPAIDTGDAATCLNTDERGVDRPQGALCDIGAYEHSTNFGSPAYLIYYSGDNQITPPNKIFLKPLSVHVTDNLGNLLSGVPVQFDAPDSGPSLTFLDTGTTTTVNTDSNGLAESPGLISNSQIGGPYPVTASVNGTNTVTFNLTNKGWYVAPAPLGNDANTCSTPDMPCSTINAAINKASADETILVATGTYTGSGTGVYTVTIPKHLNIFGGWDNIFNTQSGYSLIDGQITRGDVRITAIDGNVLLDHFAILNGLSSVGGGVNIIEWFRVCNDLKFEYKPKYYN